MAVLLVVGALRAVWQQCSAFAHVGPRPRRGAAAAAATRRNAVEEERASQKKWQQGIDMAFLDVDASLAERFAGLREVLSSPGEVASSLRDAVAAVTDKKLSNGQTKALDAVFPRGTLARSDLDGLLAVTRQVPEVVGDLADSMPGVNATEVAPDLDQVRSTLQRLLTPEGISSVADTAFDGLRATPRGFQEPAFEVSAEGENFEVRRYANFTLATRAGPQPPPPASSLSAADPFSALGVYLLSGSSGSNDGDGPTMNMTMPMHIEYSTTAIGPLSVSFMMSEGMAAIKDDDLQKSQAPEKVLAVRKFPGIATMAETARQHEDLLAELAKENIYVPRNPGTYSVLQYNPPYTIPWRRRNEIAIEVTYNATAAQEVEEARARKDAEARAAAEAESGDASEDLVEDAEVLD